MSNILAIESSCDETAVAVLSGDRLLSSVISSQIDMHRKYGGVMPEIASRLHVENIGVCLKEAIGKSGLSFGDMNAFAVTRGPGLAGCLHVGVQAAKTLSMLYGKPLIAVHHLAGHIYANEYVGELKFPLLAVVVSGGNSELVYMPRHMEFEVLGATRDDAVGECYDKVARVLGLPYPGGLPIDQKAKFGRHTYDLPLPLRAKGTYDFSYSGLKTAVINLVHKIESRGEKVNVEDMCRSFQDTAIEMIVSHAIAAAKDKDVRQIVLSGGVSANSYLRLEIERRLLDSGIEVLLPPLWCTTDNAAMIAKVASHLYDMKFFAPLDIAPDPNWKIEDWRKLSL